MTQDERAAAVASVRHSSELEGGRSTDASRALQDQWVAGDFDLDELGRRTRALHGLPVGQDDADQDDVGEREVDALVQAFLPDALIDSAVATLDPDPDLDSRSASAN